MKLKKQSNQLIRGFELSFIILISPLLVTVFIIIYILILLIDNHNPIFISKRSGLNLKKFNMYKFRSMTGYGSELEKKKYKKSQGNQITNFGSILRKSSLDEIPQFYNVLIGTMSIVGPRPALPSQKNLLKKRKKKNITSLKPGITGWAQINGRDYISDTVKLHLEEYYLNNRSLLLNIKIIILTFIKIFKKRSVKH